MPLFGIWVGTSSLILIRTVVSTVHSRVKLFIIFRQIGDPNKNRQPRPLRPLATPLLGDSRPSV